MVEIECHKCGKVFIPHKCIDTNMYDGEVRCPECKAFLHVKLVKGKLQKRKIVENKREGDVPVSIVYKQVGDRDAKGTEG